MNANVKMTVGVAVSIPNVCLHRTEFAAAFHDRAHSRKTEGTELRVKRIDGVPKIVHRRRDYINFCAIS
jgi:hypothetical protein